MATQPCAACDIGWGFVSLPSFPGCKGKSNQHFHSACEEKGSSCSTHSHTHTHSLTHMHIHLKHFGKSSGANGFKQQVHSSFFSCICSELSDNHCSTRGFCTYGCCKQLFFSARYSSHAQRNPVDFHNFLKDPLNVYLCHLHTHFCFNSVCMSWKSLCFLAVALNSRWIERLSFCSFS